MNETVTPRPARTTPTELPTPGRDEPLGIDEAGDQVVNGRTAYGLCLECWRWHGGDCKLTPRRPPWLSYLRSA